MLLPKLGADMELPMLQPMLLSIRLLYGVGWELAIFDATVVDVWSLVFGRVSDQLCSSSKSFLSFLVQNHEVDNLAVTN